MYVRLFGKSIKLFKFLVIVVKIENQRLQDLRKTTRLN